MHGSTCGPRAVRPADTASPWIVCGAAARARLRALRRRAQAGRGHVRRAAARGGDRRAVGAVRAAAALLPCSSAPRSRSHPVAAPPRGGARGRRGKLAIVNSGSTPYDVGRRSSIAAAARGEVFRRGPGPRADLDVLVIGSGFGGSVTALRLAEKGYRVGVVEAGRRFGPDDFARTNWHLRRFLWMPRPRAARHPAARPAAPGADPLGGGGGRRLAGLRQHPAGAPRRLLRGPPVAGHHRLEAGTGPLLRPGPPHAGTR